MNLKTQDAYLRFFEYINYDWEHSEPWNQFRSMMSEEARETKSPQEREEQRRKFYSQKVDSQFDSCYALAEPQEKQAFLDFCRNQASMMSVNKNGVQPSFRQHKQLLYLVFLIMLPIHRPIAIMSFVGATIANVLERIELGKTVPMHILLSDEDTLNMSSLCMLLFCGKVYTALFLWTLVIWAVLNVCEGGHHHLQGSGRTALKHFEYFFDWVRLHRFWLMKIKADLEVLIAVTCLFGWIGFALCAPLLPIVYIQVIRLKYVTSQFVREGFAAIDSILSRALPEALLDMIRQKLKPHMRDQSKESSEMALPDTQLPNKRTQSDERLAKSNLTEQKIYEVPSDDLD